MNNLTMRDEFNNADVVGVDSEKLQDGLTFKEFNCMTIALNKLAEYEDIGIEPERLKEFLGNFGISIVMKNTKLMNELQENEEIISKMAKRLKSFEENTFNTGWIPVSERLPEGTERVIVTLENGMVLEVFFISGEFKFHEGLLGGGLEKVPYNNQVIAWQPLPEPYKEVLE